MFKKQILKYTFFCLLLVISLSFQETFASDNEEDEKYFNPDDRDKEDKAIYAHSIDENNSLLSPRITNKSSYRRRKSVHMHINTASGHLSMILTRADFLNRNSSFNLFGTTPGSVRYLNEDTHFHFNGDSNQNAQSNLQMTQNRQSFDKSLSNDDNIELSYNSNMNSGYFNNQPPQYSGISGLNNKIDDGIIVLIGDKGTYFTRKAIVLALEEQHIACKTIKGFGVGTQAVSEDYFDYFEANIAALLEVYDIVQERKVKGFLFLVEQSTFYQDNSYDECYEDEYKKSELEYEEPDGQMSVLEDEKQPFINVEWMNSFVALFKHQEFITQYINPSSALIVYTNKMEAEDVCNKFLSEADRLSKYTPKEDNVVQLRLLIHPFRNSNNINCLYQEDKRIDTNKICKLVGHFKEVPTNIYLDNLKTQLNFQWLERAFSEKGPLYVLKNVNHKKLAVYSLLTIFTIAMLFSIGAYFYSYMMPEKSHKKLDLLLKPNRNRYSYGLSTSEVHFQETAKGKSKMFPILIFILIFIFSVFFQPNKKKK